MTTLVIAATDNVTLRIESDDPAVPGWLLLMAQLSSDDLEKNRSQWQAVRDDLVCFGTAAYTLDDDGKMMVHNPVRMALRIAPIELTDEQRAAGPPDIFKMLEAK